MLLATNNGVNRMLREYAVKMSDLTLRLFALCQEREINFVRRYGLRVSEFRCLYTLWRQDHRTVKELANLLNNTPSRLTRVIDSLFEKGLVERVEPSDDRRKKIISLSDAGRELVKTMKEEYDTIHTQILAEITDDSQGQIIDSIAKLITAMELWKSKYGFEEQKDEES